MLCVLRSSATERYLQRENKKSPMVIFGLDLYIFDLVVNSSISPPPPSHRRLAFN